MAVTKEAPVSSEEFARELLLHLYKADTPETLDEIADVLWSRHQSAFFTPPTIQNELESLAIKGVVTDKSGKFKLSQEAKRFVEEACLANILNLSDLPETHDEQQGIIVKNLLPEALSQQLNLSFALVTWEKPTPVHSFRTITETFLFTLPGEVVIDGEHHEVKGSTILTLPAGRKISLVPRPATTLQAFVITKPQFDPKDMVVLDKKIW